jgi:uncharacterized surface protein with fasciclin (FAS1) repeats
VTFSAPAWTESEQNLAFRMVRATDYTPQRIRSQVARKFTVEKKKKMKRITLSTTTFTIAAVATLGMIMVSTPAMAQKAEQTKMVGGAAMYPTKNIVQNAVNSRDHTTLVAAVKAAGLVETLESAGPFTVFAPVNKAFEKLPSGTVPMLLKPENKEALTGILTYHVIAGRLSAMELMDMVKKGGGKATLKTVQGGILTVIAKRKSLVVTDEKGGMAHITISDVNQSNGVIHVVDAVLMHQ